jgi:hypothetical protein
LAATSSEFISVQGAFLAFEKKKRNKKKPLAAIFAFFFLVHDLDS